MSNDEEQHETPPDIINEDDSNSKDDDSMFVSVMLPNTVDVSLSGGEDNDENPFDEPTTREKTPTNTTNTIESSVDNENKLPQHDKATPHVDKNEPDLFGEEFSNDNSSPFGDAPQTPPVTVPKQEPKTPPVTPLKQDVPLFSTESKVYAAEPVRPVSTFESQTSLSKPVTTSVFSDLLTESKPVKKRSNEYNIAISVGNPTKVGEGMSSYVVYQIKTKTTLTIFNQSEFSVKRRFSDFLGLHAKLVHKHAHVGVFLPSPPEKDTLSMAKVKVSKEEVIPIDFIDRRRALLERYLNRLVRHPKLLEDSDVKDFIQSDKELPKSTNTQALSGAGVLRAFSTISNQVTKITTKKSEQDEWFDEKHVFVEELHKHFKNLFNQLNSLFTHRKEAVIALKTFSTTLNHLATTEEHPLLSSALIELANLKEKLEQIHNDQTIKEYSILTELIKEYISLLEMVQLSFHERIKTHQQWLNAEDTLRKKRETKTKLEQSAKSADKLPQAEKEILDWESKVVHCKEDFENISTTIRQEMDVFEQIRMDDFQTAFDDYLNDLLEQENKILQIWEAYLPEANKINL
ncbi:unnamed protein product [Rotaria socialis]|uniref:PX domain-containing protein n=1 Tax=Rotaria socialis TaxID=392032 RepID=A0A821NAW8_9BILA|nr:unnamed protein product [Rotaria socialis]CAF4781503.1 unnamed protein product [Rotaria socialis]